MGAQVESALSQKVKVLTCEEIAFVKSIFHHSDLKSGRLFQKSHLLSFLCEQGYKDLSVALVHEKKSGFLHTVSTILSEEKNVEKSNYPSLNDQILQQDLQNFYLPDNSTYSDVAEVSEDHAEDDYEGLPDGNWEINDDDDDDEVPIDNEDGSETSMPSFYNGMEDESFLDNSSES
ncbi:hypothetical protein L873DRAFT_1796061 [Choiromyces venosus 120613-1]|uniref:Uncharacterized protein n=1 Tax=Choiromyces venosus 120613-1 TaxID=1336337 RepID=A0A3N4IUM4_9PEZI|nr:hypothetical protein L873DRAFT_1796061 [Choiromyces venosus 120613-1]